MGGRGWFENDLGQDKAGVRVLRAGGVLRRGVGEKEQARFQKRLTRTANRRFLWLGGRSLSSLVGSPFRVRRIKRHRMMRQQISIKMSRGFAIDDQMVVNSFIIQSHHLLMKKRR